MKIKNLVTILTLSTIIWSCGETETPIQEIDKNDLKDKMTLMEDPLLKEKTSNIENIIWSIPTPVETMKILQESGAYFDIQLTNNPENRDNYTSKADRALNLGVYGADMNYCSAFDKTSDMMIISSCADDMASKLGLDGVFSKDVYDRLYEYSEDKDSVQSILASTFWEMESYLNEDGRPELAAMIILGGWIEGMNIACGQAKINDINSQMIERIAEQELALNSVIKLGKMYPDSDRIQEIVTDLEDLKSTYVKIEKVKTSGENVDNDDGSISIGGKTDYIVSEDVLQELTVKVYKIRSAIIGE